MGKSPAPTPPDPKKTGAAATGTNVGTAIANTAMRNVNRITPTGNLNYAETGTKTWHDPFTDQTYNVPLYTATETLSPNQQAIFNQGEAAKLGLAQGATGIAQNLANRQTGPIDTTAIESRINQLGRQRLDPRFNREQARLESRLANQGLTQGSAAWGAEMQNFGQNKNDAYNQLALNGRGQALSEIMAMRNQPINEATALMSGSQVSVPNFGINTPSGIPTTNMAGLINKNFDQKMGIWQNQQQTSRAIMGGLFGLLGGISDRRLKKDISLIGNNGHNIYEFRYLWEPDDVPLRRGYMAQEILLEAPQAIVRFGKWLALNYEKLPSLKGI